MSAPVVAIVVTKRNPLVTLGRAQKYRWHAINWNNRETLAVSSEAYTNHADALKAAVQLFADKTVDQAVLDAAKLGERDNWVQSNVYLVEDGVSGLQAMRLQPPTS